MAETQNIENPVESESKIKAALLSRASYFRQQAESLTFEGVSRLLEKDLGLEPHDLDTRKRFVKRSLQQCIESASLGNLTGNQVDAGENVLSSTGEAKLTDEVQIKKEGAEAIPGSEENMEDSPVRGLMTGPKKMRSDPDLAEETKSKGAPSESTIKKAVWDRASYLREPAELNVTLAGVRRLLEEDLELEKHALDPFKKFINQQVEQVMLSLDIPETTTSRKKTKVEKQAYGKASSVSIEDDVRPYSESDRDEAQAYRGKRMKLRRQGRPQLVRESDGQPDRGNSGQQHSSGYSGEQNSGPHGYRSSGKQSSGDSSLVFPRALSPPEDGVTNTATQLSIVIGSSSQKGKKAAKKGKDAKLHAFIKKNPFKLEGKHLERFQKLALKTVEHPRYLHNPTLHDLDIHGDVRTLFENVGMGQFVDLCPPGHQKLILEFLSTLEIEGGSLSFQINLFRRRLTLAQFCNIFLLRPPIEDENARDTDYTPLGNLWLRLTGSSEIDFRSSKASLIRNPTFRYVQRVLATGIFARGDSMGVIERGEARIMCAMIDPNSRVDVGFLFAKHLYGMATNTKAKRIHGGGLITKIAEHFRYNPSTSGDPPMSPQFINLVQLAQYKMLTTWERRPVWQYHQPGPKAQPLYALIPHGHTSLANEDNWLWEPLEGYFEAQKRRILLQQGHQQQGEQEAQQEVPQGAPEYAPIPQPHQEQQIPGHMPMPHGYTMQQLWGQMESLRIENEQYRAANDQWRVHMEAWQAQYFSNYPFPPPPPQ